MAREVNYLHARPRRDYSFRTILAIDWGSHSVRPKLFFKLEGREPAEKLVSFIPRPADMTTDRGEMKGQFTSDIYPFGDNEPNPPGDMIYPGNTQVLGRRPISSKIAMYAVVGLPDKVADESPHLKLLVEEAEANPHIKQNIRIGIQHMLFRVLRAVSDTNHGILQAWLRELDAVALTIPAQWTVEFEEEYGRLLTAAWEQVFATEPPQIIFLSEGQTNVHYAFYRGTWDARYARQYVHAGGICEIGRTSNAVLVVDAGGHSTNTSLVTVCDDDNQLEIRPDDGAIGGTAIWAWHVVDRAEAAWKTQFKTTSMPLKVKSEILSTFYLLNPMYTEESGAFFRIKQCDPDGEDWFFSVRPEELVQAFNDGFAHSFTLIEEGLDQLIDLRPNCDRVEVMVGGGSTKGGIWRDRMNDLCTRRLLEVPTFLCGIDPNTDHARIAAGANYALANAKSVAQFVERAAFGLAVKKWYKNGDVSTHEWDCQATLLWAQGQKWTRTIKTDGSQEFKVICQPNFDNPQAESVIDTDYMAYDLLEIPCRKRGALKFDFEIDLVNDRLKLTVKKKLGRAKRFSELGAVEFDLWVSPGSRCLQIWDCQEEIEARVAAAFSPGQQQAAGGAVNGGGGGIAGSARLLRGQLGALPAPAAEDEDVEMGGIDDPPAIAGSGREAAASREALPRCPRRHGSTIPTGIRAV